MHPVTCDLSQTVSKTTYLVSMESIKSSQTKPISTATISPAPTQIRNLSSSSSSLNISKSSENYVSTTTRSTEGSKEARFQCGYCDKSFATPSKVKRHILTHTGEKPFVCQFCQRGFSQKVHMMEHISKHHADESLKAQQDAAAAAAAQAAAAAAAAPAPLIRTLPNNKTVYTSGPGGQVTAVPVIQTAGSVQSIRLPNTVVADSTAVLSTIPENSYIVAEFSLKPEEQDQVGGHHHVHDQVGGVGVDDEPQQHEILATIPLSSNLTISREPVVSGTLQSHERPFVCPHCSADFIRQSNLSVHMMKVHGEAVEVRTHQCSYCDKKFKYPNKRRLHEMTHTGEKPNVCQFCSMGFFKKSRLRVHLTKHHGIPEDEVNNPNSTYLSPTASTSPDPGTHVTPPPVVIGTGATTINIQKTIQSLTPVNGIVSTSSGDLFCQYCQKPFSNKEDLKIHEQQEAMEFEQLFDDTEFSGLGVGNGSQTDIIQNALLTAGIENGLGSPSVTDSDSVVTISEADIDSFSIGFIPDGNWSTEVVNSNLPNSSDPFYPSQPLDLNVKTETVTVTEASSDSSLQSIAGTIYTSSETFQNIKTEPLTSLPNLTSGDINQIWETTVALPTTPCTINNVIKEPMGEMFTTSSSTLNGILTETFSIPTNHCDTLSTSIISLPANIINGNELDLSKLTVTAGTNFLEATEATGGFQGTIIQATSTSRGQPIIWQDDPTLPAGWKTRQHFRDNGHGHNKVDTYYMAPDGSQFRSKWKIVEYMESSGAYCQEDIDWVKNSITTPKPDTVSAPRERSDKLKREWKDDPKTVPDGWKVAWTTTSDNRSKIAFMSPDKKIFHSRKAALQHMMQAGIYSSEDILKMTKGLNVLLNVGDEWKEGDKSLPEGWKIRSHQWWCQKRNSHRIHYEFLSPENEFFKSRKAVVEHMTASGIYTAEQIEMVKQQATIITDRSIKKKVTSTPTRQDLSPCNPLIGWKTGNTTLPIGWKIKRHEYANQTVYFYMSPKGDIIKSRRAVLEYMFDDEEAAYTEKDFLTVISGAKQRKVALQELYDAKLLRKTGGVKRKRRSKSDDSEVEEELMQEYASEMEEEVENNNVNTTENNDNEDVDDDDDKFEDLRRSAKKPKVEKEPILPTRRSGRIKEKKKEITSDNDDSDSELEGHSRGGVKRRGSGENENQVVPVVTQVVPAPGGEVKRKRGRPPKIAPQSFDTLQTGDGRRDRSDEGLVKSEERIVKLELFKVDLNNANDIKDVPYLSSLNEEKNPLTNEIIKKEEKVKVEYIEDHHSIKKEHDFQEEYIKSIHTEQNAIDKVTVDEFFVDRGEDVSTNLVKKEIYSISSNAGLDSIKNNLVDLHDLSAYDVVVDVLHDLVSSISE